MLEDWSYDEIESGRPETLVKAIERIEKLEKQLNLAKLYLKKYADEDSWIAATDAEWDTQDIFLDGCGYYPAQKALQEIDEC